MVMSSGVNLLTERKVLDGETRSIEGVWEEGITQFNFWMDLENLMLQNLLFQSKQNSQNSLGLYSDG